MTVAPPELAQRIRRAREASQLSQRALATRMGVSPATIHHWEIGRQEPSVDKIERLALIFEVSAEELIVGRRPARARVLPLLTPAHLAGLVADAPADELVESITVTDEEARRADVVFVLRGDSMEPAFQDGDLLGIHRQPTAEIGDYVVARIGDDLTFKRFGGRTQQGIVLAPLNPRHEPIIAAYAEIVGVYRWLRRSAPDR